MKIYQIRHAYGKRLDEFYKDSVYEYADEFVTEERAQQIIAANTYSEEKPCVLLPYIKWPTAKILREREIDIERADVHVEDAPDYKPLDAFERAAIRTVAYPQESAQGYPRSKVTIRMNGNLCNVMFKIAPARDTYDWPCWALM